MKKQKKQPNTPAPVPGWCYVLEGYLKGWAPAPAYEKGVVLRTSLDIVNDLEDMTELNASTVSSVMSQLGFRPHFCAEGPHGWMMSKSPGAVHEIRPYEPDSVPSDE